MAVVNLEAGLATPQIVPGMVLTAEALDPDTFLPVAGVTIGTVVISGSQISAEGALTQLGGTPTWVWDGDG